MNAVHVGVRGNSLHLYAGGKTSSAGWVGLAIKAAKWDISVLSRITVVCYGTFWALLSEVDILKRVRVWRLIR